MRICEGASEQTLEVGLPDEQGKAASKHQGPSWKPGDTPNHALQQPSCKEWGSVHCSSTVHIPSEWLPLHIVTDQHPSAAPCILSLLLGFVLSGPPRYHNGTNTPMPSMACACTWTCPVTHAFTLSRPAYIDKVHVKAQGHPVMWVVWYDKAVVHQEKVIAEGPIAQQQRLTSSNLVGNMTTTTPSAVGVMSAGQPPTAH